MAAPLKLRAQDEEDLAVLSAILQDALVTVGDMVFLPEERRFVLVANRFRWEPAAGGERHNFERILSGLCIDGVQAVQRRGFRPAAADRILELLAIRAAPGRLYFDFAGDAGIRLEVEGIRCRLEDLGEPWPTRWRPRHPVDEARGSG
jgi:hypothetical protein